MRGSLPLKIRLPGCLPIRKASGTHDPKVRTKLIRMVHTLHEQGRDDLVNGIAKGTLKPLQVYSQFRFNRLDELPHADELPLLRDKWREWLDQARVSDTTLRDARLYFLRLEKLVPEDATLGAIVGALRDFREAMHSHPRSFNYAKSHVQAFVRWALTKRHRAYLDICDVPPLKVTVKRTKHPLTPDQLRQLVKNLGAPWGPMAWTMATTGMHWKEYVGPWEREGLGLRIHGTKRGGRDRLVPLVSLLHAPEGTETTFRRHLHGVTPRIAIYDLRRTYAGLMVEANIPRPRRRSYMGHGADDITALYETQEVREYLVQDAAKMRAVLGEPEGGPLLQMVRA